MPTSEISKFASLTDWRALKKTRPPFFPTRSSLESFIKLHRRELIERGALLPGRGRMGSLVEVEKFSLAVVEIYSRQAIENDAARAAG